MLTLTINEKGGPSRTETFDKEEVTIGRVQGNDIILAKGNISKRHSRIVLKDGKLVIQDLKSTNGTYVNGKKISDLQVIKSTDKVYIGDFTLQVERQDEAGFGFDNGASASGAFDDGFDVDLPSQAGSPGLIHDSFEQDFDPPRSGLPDPEPMSNELDFDPGFEGIEGSPDPSVQIDGGFGIDDGVDLDLGGQSDPEPLDPGALEPVPPDQELTPPPMMDDAAPTSMPEPGPAPSLIPDPPAEFVAAQPPEEVFSPPSEPSEPAPPAPIMTPPAPEPAPPAPVAPPPSPAPVAAVSMAAPLEPLSPEQALHEIQRALHHCFAPAEQPLARFAALEDQAQDVALRVVQTLAARLPGWVDTDGLAGRAVARTFGLGPLAELLADEEIFEVFVTSDGDIHIDRQGQLEAAGMMPMNEAARIDAIHTLAGMSGEPLEPGETQVDARLRTGARVTATLPGFGSRGPVLGVRKTSRELQTLETLREYETIDDAMLAYLDEAVRSRSGILLSTGPGVTASATMNALIARVPVTERLVAAERGVELHLRAHALAQSVELDGPDAMDAALRLADTLQADRVFAGRLEPNDVSPLLAAFDATLGGGIASVAARGAEDAIDRLVDWVAIAREGDELGARHAVAHAFPVVLHEQRFADEVRRITEVAELSIDDAGELHLTPRFHWDGSFVAASGAEDSTRAYVPEAYTPAPAHEPEEALAEAFEPPEHDVDEFEPTGAGQDEEVDVDPSAYAD